MLNRQKLFKITHVIFVIYLKCVPVTNESVAWNDCIVVKNEQDMMWKEAVVVLFNVKFTLATPLCTYNDLNKYKFCQVKLHVSIRS